MGKYIFSQKLKNSIVKNPNLMYWELPVYFKE